MRNHNIGTNGMSHFQPAKVYPTDGLVLLVNGFEGRVCVIHHVHRRCLAASPVVIPVSSTTARPPPVRFSGLVALAAVASLIVSTVLVPAILVPAVLVPAVLVPAILVPAILLVPTVISATPLVASSIGWTPRPSCPKARVFVHAGVLPEHH